MKAVLDVPWGGGGGVLLERKLKCRMTHDMFLESKKTQTDGNFLLFSPVLQALLWAPSPRFWFLCSSFALGGLATKGLRLPSLKSDVHSTCWFFKQLCPQKIRTSRSPSALGGIGDREGGGGRYWARAIRFYFSVSLFLSLPNDLSITVFSQVFFFFFPFPNICLIEPNHGRCLEWWRGSPVKAISLKASLTES